MIIKQINKLSDFLNVIANDQVTWMSSPLSGPREVQSATAGANGVYLAQKCEFLSPLLSPKGCLLRGPGGSQCLLADPALFIRVSIAWVLCSYSGLCKAKSARLQGEEIPLPPSNCTAILKVLNRLKCKEKKKSSKAFTLLPYSELHNNFYLVPMRLWSSFDCGCVYFNIVIAVCRVIDLQSLQQL